MMLSPGLIYFADLADSITNLFVFLAVIFLVWLLFYLAIYAADDSHVNNCEDKKCVKCKKMRLEFKRLFSCSILFFILTFFIPSTKTVYKMIIIPTVVNSNVIQKLPDELQQYIDKVISNKDDK